jgi:coproporphyrinogen III oxidase-like Fe-S oxidoreductase
VFTEYILTKYLRYYNGKNLIFDTHSDITPPEPATGKKPLLYIHIPFCEELCPYCSFNRFKFQKNIAKEYFQSLKKEILNYKKIGFDFYSSYIGGGTPTILINELSEIVYLIKELFSIKEISCETNPNHLTDNKIKILSQCGIDRLSVGVQSFDNELLKKMDRFHKYGSGEEIQARIKDTLGAFPTLNIDMIFNFPTQTIEHIRKDCEIIKNLKADQVTFYPLMASASTEKTIKKRFGKISYAHEKLLYNEIATQIEKEYTPGTAWCFSRKKTMIDEYIIDYDEYLGAGSGSFGYYNGRILSNTFDLNEYNTLISKGKLSLKAEKKFSLLEQMRYDFLIKLFGITLKKDFISRKYGNSFYRKLFKEFAFFRLNGALEFTPDEIKLTRKGQYYWVIMMREFFIGVNNFRDYCRNLIGER